MHIDFPQEAVRIYSRLEHGADAVVHVLGIVFAVAASLWLLWNVSGFATVAAVSVYCAGLLAMIVASAAYNLAPTGTLKEILRRFDHSAIFVMIAATYTPFAATRLGYPVGDEILALIWTAAVFGVGLKMFFPRRFEKVSVVLYLAMGWLIVTAIEPLAASVAAIDFWLLMGGGFIYSAGVAFYLIERIPFHKAIWHGFVLTAAVLHYTAIVIEFAN
ncbi:MAG TPA: hemolysin III family protein [Rhizomicrobium sp.]|nr:hemolysin III family protein [Rhizomicrobium sp.]